MSVPMVSVVIPTVRGREKHYARCVAAYQRTTKGAALQLITIRDAPACGVAWNMGAESARGDYLHITADDLEPHPGWLQAALEAVGQGYLPGPRIRNADGSGYGHPDSMTPWPDWTPVDVSVIPFMSWEQWLQIGPSLQCHYFTDNYLSWRAARAGYKTVLRTGYAFTHHWAQARRGAGMTQEQRMVADRDVFEAAKIQEETWSTRT